MPSARSASPAPRRRTSPAPQRPRPRRVAPRRSRVRFRWDRVGRIGLLLTLGVVVYLYVQQGLSYLSSRSEAHRDAAIVKRLSGDNAALTAQQKSLQDPATIERSARALGMVKVGERPYVVSGLPKK